MPASLSRRFEDLMMHFYDPAAALQVRQRRRRHFRSRQQIPRKRAVCKLKRAFFLSFTLRTERRASPQIPVRAVTMQTSTRSPQCHFSYSAPCSSSPPSTSNDTEYHQRAPQVLSSLKLFLPSFPLASFLSALSPPPLSSRQRRRRRQQQQHRRHCSAE